MLRFEWSVPGVEEENTAVIVLPCIVRRGRVLDFYAVGRGFDLQPEQKVISIFSTYFIWRPT